MLIRPSKFKRRGQTDLFSKHSRSELFVRCQTRRYIKPHEIDEKRTQNCSRIRTGTNYFRSTGMEGWIWKKQDVMWTELAPDRIYWRAIVNTMLEFWVSQKTRFLNRLTNITFCRRTEFLGLVAAGCSQCSKDWSCRELCWRLHVRNVKVEFKMAEIRERSGC